MNLTPIVPDVPTERAAQLADGCKRAGRLLETHGVACDDVDLVALITLAVLEWVDDDMPPSAIRATLEAVRTAVPSEIH